ncbi:hypothetical protein D3C76_1540980 [compost metagenome]
MAVGAALKNQYIASVANTPTTIKNGLRPYLSVNMPPNGMTNAADRLAMNT